MNISNLLARLPFAMVDVIINKVTYIFIKRYTLFKRFNTKEQLHTFRLDLSPTNSTTLHTYTKQY